MLLGLEVYHPSLLFNVQHIYTVYIHDGGFKLFRAKPSRRRVFEISPDKNPRRLNPIGFNGFINLRSGHVYLQRP